MMRLARVTALCLLALGGGAVAADGAPEHLRLARYTTAAALPDPALTAPLALLAQVSFPRDAVATVGDALAYLLLRTGYRLGETDAAAGALLALPLPEAHRQLGPYSVRAIAAVLVGAAYELQISEIDRRLNVVLAEPVPQTPALTLTPIATAPAAEPAPLAAVLTVAAEALPVEIAPAPELPAEPPPVLPAAALPVAPMAHPFAVVLP